MPSGISLSSLLAPVLSGVVGSLFGGGDKQQAAPAAVAAAPTVEPPTVMPTKDDAAAQKAKQRSIAAQIAQRGRASTILTGDDTASQAMG